VNDAENCAQLLEVVLEVLGSQVAADVCQAVQQQRLAEFLELYPHPSARHPPQLYSYMAKAVLSIILLLITS
jgi:hypothetical protein